MQKNVVGQSGEAFAAAFLEKKGYRVLERNYRSRFGEIDLIAQDGKTIVFVEVKARRTLRWGDPAQAVHHRKQQKIFQVAQLYLMRQEKEDVPCRFDVVEVIITPDGSSRIHHILNAFEG